MDITKLQKVNQERLKRWHSDSEPWTLLEYAGAMCGESGEAANFAKKIKRIHQRLPNFKRGLATDKINELNQALAKEVADSIIYSLIILSELDMDASEVIANVYDQKSIEYGFPERAPR